MRIFTLLLITIAASAFAKEKVFGNGSLPAFLRHFDTNSDGLIDKISENEVVMARAALREQIDHRRLQKFSSIAGEDNRISREEYLTIPGVRSLPDFIFEAVWSRLDTDGSGHVSPEEFLSRLLRH